MAAIKHKSWVGDIARVRGDTEARHGWLRLDRNERVSPFSDDFWKQVHDELTQEAVLAYPQQELLYTDLANFYGLLPENFVLTAGSDLAIRNAFELCVQPGDTVVYMSPTYAMVDVYAQLFNATSAKIEFENDLTFNLDRLLSVIDDDVSLVVVANPNSPTGTILSSDQVESILQKAAQFNTAVLIDEAYFEFCNETCLPLINKYQNLIVARTFSKACGLAGLRVGFLAANAEVADLLYKFRPMYEISSPSASFARAIINNYNEVEAYAQAVTQGKHFLQNRLKEIGFHFLGTHTNFMHIDLGEYKSDICTELEKDKILIRSSLPGDRYKTYVRVTLGPKDVMQRVIACLEKVMPKCN